MSRDIVFYLSSRTLGERYISALRLNELKPQGAGTEVFMLGASDINAKISTSLAEQGNTGKRVGMLEMIFNTL